jgi:hypothetical protein
MTHADAGKYAEKHALGKNVEDSLAAEITRKADNGEIGCAQAEAIAAKQGLGMGDVGVAIDLMEIRLKGCQLGLFGYPKDKFPGGRSVVPMTEAPPAVETAIRSRLVEGRLPCFAAWEIAAELGMRKMDVSAACECLKIRVKPCQLGAF